MVEKSFKKERTTTPPPPPIAQPNGGTTLQGRFSLVVESVVLAQIGSQISPQQLITTNNTQQGVTTMEKRITDFLKANFEVLNGFFDEKDKDKGELATIALCQSNCAEITVKECSTGYSTQYSVKIGVKKPVAADNASEEAKKKVAEALPSLLGQCLRDKSKIERNLRDAIHKLIAYGFKHCGNLPQIAGVKIELPELPQT